MVLIILLPFLLVLTVTVHYGFLTRLMAILDTGWAQSIKLIAITCGLFVAHVVEVVVYAFVYYFSHLIPGFGELPGTSFEDWINALYFHLWPTARWGPVNCPPRDGLKFSMGWRPLTDWC